MTVTVVDPSLPVIGRFSSRTYVVGVHPYADGATLRVPFSLLLLFLLLALGR
jgi:hypothetical protein